MITDNNGKIFEDRRKTNIPVSVEKRIKTKTKKEKSQTKKKAK